MHPAAVAVPFFNRCAAFNRVLGNVPNIFTHRKFLPLSITLLDHDDDDHRAAPPSNAKTDEKFSPESTCDTLATNHRRRFCFTVAKNFQFVDEIIGNLQLLLANFIIYSLFPLPYTPLPSPIHDKWSLKVALESVHIRHFWHSRLSIQPFRLSKFSLCCPSPGSEQHEIPSSRSIAILQQLLMPSQRAPKVITKFSLLVLESNQPICCPAIKDTFSELATLVYPLEMETGSGRADRKGCGNP